ncbi:hypothetical protein A3E76_04315 [Candidatus Saccharibacteria bacterium RIFCSPHIGHO2_12_FULL_44_22]|nr:MAG: hypothetical protein A3E76_04315 [Candidatus Saccharibacteria bacterium RIFCSPHIGHO2_12_FULL_44_22]
MSNFNHFSMQESTLAGLDEANKRLACEVEFMNDIEWSDHVVSDSYFLLGTEVYRNDVPNHLEINSRRRHDERRYLLNGTLIGIELGRRALGKSYDSRLSSQLSVSMQTIQKNLQLHNPKMHDMFDRIHISGSAERMRLPIMYHAVAEYSARKNLSSYEQGLLMSGIGFVARSIVTIQRNENRDLRLLDLSLTAME